MELGQKTARIGSNAKRNINVYLHTLVPNATFQHRQRVTSSNITALVRTHLTKVLLNMASATTAEGAGPLSSLKSEFADLAYAVTVQGDDEIFKTVFDRSWAPDVIEMSVITDPFCRFKSFLA